MDFRDYIRLLSRSWVLLVGLIVVGAAVGGASAAVQRPVYQSTAKAFVSTPSGQSLADLSAGAGFLQVALKGYADLATTAYVLRPVIRGERLDTTPAELSERVQVTASETEAMLQITVSDSDAARAARTANALTAQLSQAVVDLTPTGAATTAGSAVKLTPVDPALAATSPVSPNLPLAVLLGALAGLVLGVVIALPRELLDTRIRSREDLQRVTTAPLLGSTTRNPRTTAHPLVLLEAESGPQAEEYRTIRTNLRFVQLDAGNRSIVVTSPGEREGKSTAAANLALAVARLGERVLLVDADLRRPRLAALFGLDASVGLSEVLVGAVTTRQAVQHVTAGPIDVLPSGAVPPNPNELLQSRAMDGLLATLRDEYDLIVIDSPPLLAVSDAVVLSTRAGGALMVSAAGRSRRGQLRQALEMLERAEARVLGVVLTMVPGRPGTTYGYGMRSEQTAPPAQTTPPTQNAEPTVREQTVQPTDREQAVQPVQSAPAQGGPAEDARSMAFRAGTPLEDGQPVLGDGQNA